MADFTFLYPYWFFALVPLIGILVFSNKKKAISALLAPHIAKHFHVTGAKADRWIPYFTGIIWTLIVFALAAPSFHRVTSPAYTQSGARVLALQLSNSMNAQDITPSRLAQARYKALDLLPLWKEGETGLLAYAGDAYIISPMTKDAATLSNQIKQLSSSLMPFEGNNAPAAVREAISLLKGSGHSRGDIILMTDGIRAQDANKILEILKGTDWHLSFLAIATKTGAPVLDTKGQMVKDADGHSQVSQLNPEPLEMLARKTGGIYVPLTSSEQDIERIVQATRHQMAQTKKSQKKIETRSNDGYWFLLPVILLFLALSRHVWILFLCGALFLPEFSYANPLLNKDTNAYQAFSRKEYKTAAQEFEDPAWKGIAQYRAGDYKGAIASLSQASDTESLYNLGNAYARAGQLKQAMDTYKKVLQRNQEHADAKKNLAMLEKMQQQNSQQKQSKDRENERENQQNKRSSSQNAKDQNKGKQGKDHKQQDQDVSQMKKQQSASSEDKKNGKAKQEDQKKESQEKKAHSSQKNPDESSESDKKEKARQAENEMKQSLSDAQKKNAGEDVKQTKTSSLKPQEEAQVKKSDPVMRKLDQIPDDPSRLIRAQILLQAQERERQK